MTRLKLLSIGALVSLALAGTAPGAWAATISIAPLSQTASVGSAVSIDLMVSGLTSPGPPSIGTFDLDVTFNASVLQFTQATFGTGLDVRGLGSIRAATPGVGVVNLFEVSLDPPAFVDALQPATFRLATIGFTAVGVGTSPFALSLNTLGDSQGFPLSATFGTGAVNVTGVSLVPEPATVSFVALPLAVMAWRRFRARQ